MGEKTMHKNIHELAQALSCEDLYFLKGKDAYHREYLASQFADKCIVHEE